MNRLNELADALSVPNGSIISFKHIEEAAALLRAAEAEPVGTEWEACFAGYLVHNAEIAAARLAVANAKAERDDALGALRDEKALHKSIAAERDAALARVAELERANSSAPLTGSPDRDTNRDTVSGSPTTRELVARLADEVCNYFEDGSLEGVEFVARLRAIIADARRGGAE